jgi:aminoglycoside phosphotransferase (APT) family kinase protein
LLGDAVDRRGALAVWDAALAAHRAGPPVWVHGDVAAGNLLVRDGRLAAMIDFGCMAIGDPACDLVLAWTYLDGDAREAFRHAFPEDADLWARARGWALWKALRTLASWDVPRPPAMQQHRIIAAVIEETVGF